MSIYSGFPTRRDESNYNVLLSRLISLLQTDLLELLNGNVLSEKKVGAYWKVISKMRLFEEHKYLPPKFSDIMEPLANLCGFSAKTNKPNINDIEPSDVSVTRFQSEARKSANSLFTHHIPQAKQLPINYQVERKESLPAKEPRNCHDEFLEHHERKLAKIDRRYTKLTSEEQSILPHETENIINNRYTTNSKHKNRAAIALEGKLSRNMPRLHEVDIKRKLKTEGN